MPYRIDLSSPAPEAFDLLIELGALDIESISGGLAAVLPDSVTPEMLAAQLSSGEVIVSAAVGRDDASVWVLSPQTFRSGGILITPAGVAASPDALRLLDSNAFGTGHHPTTALCLEALEESIREQRPESILDVGTGSGILALAALKMGVPRAVGLDIDAGALITAAENARLNQLADRIEFILGGPDALKNQWPVVIANILAAPLIEMAPLLVPRLERRGRLILSGIHSSLESDVRRAYQHFGISQIDSKTRAGWAVLTARAPF